jgi:type III restriction enzyme
LQVLRPERPDNYYEAFDIVPVKYRPLMQSGKVLVTNWHRFAPESEHVEGGKSYAVVNKGPETPDTFARRVLEDLYDRLPIMVMNDEGHHCWRPAATEEDLATVDKEEVEEARVWLDGLDRINNCTINPAVKPGISICLDLSATPFYLKGSGHPEGRPFPWIVSDFGLVDAIESGIVKIPRLPVLDTAGRPDPKYFKLWKAITENLEPGERQPGKAKRPKPEVIYREAEGALLQIASQWKERFYRWRPRRRGRSTCRRCSSWFAITPISPRSSTGSSAEKRRRRRSPKPTLPRCSAKTTRKAATATGCPKPRNRSRRSQASARRPRCMAGERSSLSTFRTPPT